MAVFFWGWAGTEQPSEQLRFSSWLPTDLGSHGWVRIDGRNAMLNIWAGCPGKGINIPAWFVISRDQVQSLCFSESLWELGYVRERKKDVTDRN